VNLSTHLAADQGQDSEIEQKPGFQKKGPVNVLIVGVGGQGVIMVSKVLARLCQKSGFQVKQSEIHGMAKRGGAVFSHVRFGEEVWSPTIPAGKADILLALEWAEGMRWLRYLNPKKGTFICDTQRIVPPFACRNRQLGAEQTYARETPSAIFDRVNNGYAIDASRMADELGNIRVANTLLLGLLSKALDFSQEEWQSVIEEFVPPKTKELNQKAFLLGRDWVEQAMEMPQTHEPLMDPEISFLNLQKKSEIELEITESWCKGCDICVKMCPERCLKLNSEQVVELTDANACTGCRICEWLCPDLAIKLHLHLPEEIPN
jgi:indolepyruvate ferredoxin oxidoreductase beta subunit|tara:strand:- start:5032 stop:5988 length:957 start_codon:yes stop_codon:yes gene_type:complete